MTVRLSRPPVRRQAESTIALINIVFLMLIFFLIAGTLAPPLDGEVTLISTTDAQPVAPPDALFITAEGSVRAAGKQIVLEEWMAEKVGASGGEAPLVSVAADRDLPAERLVDFVAALRAAGAGTIRIVTERQ
ncbi:biopolymer transporter ExbD [Chelativorans sp. Marseille-P2723]|uniref:ExbD/TolR family protein n=1 Tax=Chelativorans sp. Marseille-P2723 TaxID=2709133 RepID=UPI00156EBDF2|nr:biopolymer transporter ExbD [Chelativorans sp. Marseille-P2723]